MNEFIWVFVHMDGCIGSYGNGREKKQDKKSPKRESMTCFVVGTRGKKKVRKLAGPVMMTRDDHLQAFGGRKLFAAHSERE